MSRDIFLRLVFSFIIVILIFALHRVITRSLPPGQPVLANEQPLLIAHRGGAGLAPENTLVAFHNSAELGADVLELDIHLTADGELAVIHDDTVDRTTNGSGPVSDYSMAELKELDAGYWFTTDDGATYPFREQDITIPTLAEVFAEFPNHRINIEIKEDRPEVAERLAEQVELAGATDRTIAASFHDHIIDYFRTLAPGVATSAGTAEIRNFYFLSLFRIPWFHRPLADAYQVPVKYDSFSLDTQRLVDDAHNMNQHVHYWTINDPTEVRHLLALGADGIMTDRPDIALEVFQELGYR